MADFRDFIVILGLSDDPHRTSNQAMELLLKNGYKNLMGIHPQLSEVQGVKIVSSVGQLPARPHTLTLYLRPDKLESLVPSIIKLNPGRIIMNPGSESEVLLKAANKAQIPIEAACTLVLLRTRQF